MSNFFGGDLFVLELGPYASTSALAAVDMTLQPDGVRAGVTDSGIYQYNKQATTGAVQATGGGHWNLVTSGYLFLGTDNVIDGSQVSTANIELADGEASMPSLHFINETNTGIYRPGTGEIGFSALGIPKFEITSTLNISYVPMVAQAGSAIAPSFTFFTDNESGFYSPASSQVSVVTAGAARFTFANTANTSTVPVISVNGTVTAPSFAFASNSQSGMYTRDNTRVSFTSGGVLGAEVTPNGIVIPSPNYLAIGNFQVVSTRVLGYVNMAGSENGDASSINTGTITATDANLQGVCRVIKALITAMLHHGLIG